MNIGSTVKVIKRDSVQHQYFEQVGTVVSIEDYCVNVEFDDGKTIGFTLDELEVQAHFTEFSKIQVKIKLFSENAMVPTYATPGSACFDIYASEDTLIHPGETVLVPTGLAFEIPLSYQMKIHPRSGISLKTPLRIGNSPACVDSDYRGEVKVLLWNTSERGENAGVYDLDNHLVSSGSLISHHSKAYKISKGDRIAQAEVVPAYTAEFSVVEELGDTERGNGGFGSSGI
jgi:dUTP pyrophosphatase